MLWNTPEGNNVFYQKWVAQENKMNEQAIQAKIQKYIKARGGYVVKTITSNRAGIPDLICCVEGKFLAIEVKAEKGVVAPLQEANGVMIEQAGGLWLIARSVEDVADFIGAYL